MAACRRCSRTDPKDGPGRLDRVTREPAPALRDRVVEIAFEHGLLLMGCGPNTMRIIPPLVVTRDEIEEGLAIFDHTLTKAEEEILG